MTRPASVQPSIDGDVRALILPGARCAHREIARHIDCCMRALPTPRGDEEPGIGFGNGLNYGIPNMGDAFSPIGTTFGIEGVPPNGGLPGSFGPPTIDPFYNPSPPGELAPYYMNLAGGLAPIAPPLGAVAPNGLVPYGPVATDGLTPYGPVAPGGPGPFAPAPLTPPIVFAPSGGGIGGTIIGGAPIDTFAPGPSSPIAPPPGVAPGSSGLFF